MKLYELKRGDSFEAVINSPDDDSIVFKINGTFLGMDGKYGKVLFDDNEQIHYFASMLEVERIK
jgi:hypothetical protein